MVLFSEWVIDENGVNPLCPTTLLDRNTNFIDDLINWGFYNRFELPIIPVQAAEVSRFLAYFNNGGLTSYFEFLWQEDSQLQEIPFFVVKGLKAIEEVEVIHIFSSYINHLHQHMKGGRITAGSLDAKFCQEIGQKMGESVYANTSFILEKLLNFLLLHKTIFIPPQKLQQQFIAEKILNNPFREERYGKEENFKLKPQSVNSLNNTDLFYLLNSLGFEDLRLIIDYDYSLPKLKNRQGHLYSSPGAHYESSKGWVFAGQNQVGGYIVYSMPKREILYRHKWPLDSF